MNRRVAIVGIGCTKVGGYPDVLEHELVIRAFKMALDDAGITKQRVQGMVFAHPRVYCKQRYFGTFVASYMRMPLLAPLSEVVGDGSTGGLAFRYAVNEVASGNVDVAVALGVSRETHVATAEHMDQSMRAVGDVDFQVPFGVTPISWYAMDATRYMYEHSVTREQLATVAVKNRRHAGLNPIAQFQDPITLTDVLNARPIVEPLGLLEVPPRSDGAAAVIVAAAELVDQFRSVPIYVRGWGYHHEGVHQIGDRPVDMLEFVAPRRAAEQAYRRAGIGPGDVDLAEIYAPCTIIEVLVSEALGLFPRGQGAAAAAAGETSLGGRIPICTSGGLQSRGHPPMVTPLYNIIEAAEQLRGEAGERQVPNARIGLTTCELGNYNAALIEVLERA